MKDKLEKGLSLSRRGFAALMCATIASFSAPMPAQAEGGDTLRFALSAFPPGLDPFRHQGGAANTVKLQIFRGLLGLDGDGNVVNELADSWEENGTEYTFKIRDDAVFHNGDPVTAADVVWSLEQITKEGSTAHFVKSLSVIETAEAVDDKTVKITLSKATPAFPKLLATPYVPILSAAAGMENPIGAGPYEITNLEEGVSIEFKAFDDYYKEGFPKTENMTMTVYKDESLRVAALETGDVDIIEYVPWQSMSKVEGNDSVVLHETTGPNMIITFNTEQPPFNDARVRQAVAYAIKREDIVKAAFYGRGKPLVGLPLDETSEIASAKTEELFSYDPDKARALLEEAGVLGQKVTLLATSTYSMHQDTALVVQAYLNEVGLETELALPEWGARVAQGNEGQYQFSINGSGTVVNDPDGLTSMIGTNPTSYRRSLGYSNPVIDELLEKGRHELDPETRKSYYEQLAAEFQQDVPLVPLTRRTQGYGTQNNVENFRALVGSSNGYTGFGFEAVEIK